MIKMFGFNNNSHDPFNYRYLEAVFPGMFAFVWPEECCAAMGHELETQTLLSLDAGPSSWATGGCQEWNIMCRCFDKA